MEKVRIMIFDTTLRDGEQSPGCTMNLEEKLRLARQLCHLGVDIIEAGFPIASEGDFEAVRAIAHDIQGPTIAALARATIGDIERAWQAIQVSSKPRIHIVLATSDIHLQYKLKITREQCLHQGTEAVKFARSLCADVEFSAEDSTRTDLEFLCQVAEAVVDAGANTVNLPDTVGYTIPTEISQMIKTVYARTRRPDREVVLSTHCHNDLGLAVT